MYLCDQIFIFKLKYVFHNKNNMRSFKRWIKDTFITHENICHKTVKSDWNIKVSLAVKEIIFIVRRQVSPLLTFNRSQQKTFNIKVSINFYGRNRLSQCFRIVMNSKNLSINKSDANYKLWDIEKWLRLDPPVLSSQFWVSILRAVKMCRWQHKFP